MSTAEHQRSGVPPDGLQQFVKAIPIVFDTRTAKRAGRRSATTGKKCSGNNNRQSKGGPLVEQPAHGVRERCDSPDQWDAGVGRDLPHWIGIPKPVPFVMLGSLRFGAMLSLWRSTGALRLAIPGPTWRIVVLFEPPTSLRAFCVAISIHDLSNEFP